MTPLTLFRRNLTHYASTNLAVVLGVSTAVAVLAGALLVGESVKASLGELFLGRLGKTDQVIAAATFFRDELAADLAAHEDFDNSFVQTCPLILVKGFVIAPESGRRASNVLVYGIDDRFWRFHGRPAMNFGSREILLSPGLAEELQIRPGNALLVRVEKPSAIPGESWYGRKDEVAQTIRFSVRDVLPASSLGEFSTSPQQSTVRAVFVSLPGLQKDLTREGKVNTILVAERTGAAQDNHKPAHLKRLLKDCFTLEDLGITLRVLERQNCLSLESESAVLSDAVVDSARQVATQMGLQRRGVLTYLANSIRRGEREIPYSLVSAVDLQMLGLSDSPPTERMAPMVLNEWAAQHLQAGKGDPIGLEYYLWTQEGQLLTRTAEFRVQAIVALRGWADDRELTPAYPGITDSLRLSDWDPPFPIDLRKIRRRDEEYWDRYRTTPKAFVPLEKGQELWGSRFGKLTSLRFFPASTPRPDLEPVRVAYGRRLRVLLDPLQFGFSIHPARREGLEASRGGTDFGEYFAYFSFFLVASALLLAGLFFRLGIEQRLREIGMLQAMGFPPAKIRTLFLCEGLLLTLLGSSLGMPAAWLYVKLLMWGLRTWWIDAVGTTALSPHLSWNALLLGAVGGMVAAPVFILWTLGQLRTTSTRALLSGVASAADSPLTSRRSVFWAVVFCALGLSLPAAASAEWIGQTAGFFAAGIFILIGLLCGHSAWLRRRRGSMIRGPGAWAVSRLGFRNAACRAGRSLLCMTLIASATLIIVAVGAFRRDTHEAALDKKSGSGGFALLAESLLPLHYDLNSSEGWKALGLAAEEERPRKETYFARFRLRPGDDTSCLNLYRPRNPRILAPTADFLESGRFAFRDSLARTPEEKANPWLLLRKEASGGAIPVMADANSLSYVLRLRVGDQWWIDPPAGPPVRLQIVGALDDSIFQAELLMSEEHFLHLFPEQQGYRFFLADIPPAQSAGLSRLLEDRLSGFGFDVIATDERLSRFHRVENTYISTFQTLGALGLALGTVGLAAVLLRNVLERRREFALLRAVGYHSTHFALMVMAENVYLLLGGLITGIIAALVATAPALLSRGTAVAPIPLMLVGAVFACGLLASLAATAAAVRSPLLPALKVE